EATRLRAVGRRVARPGGEVGLAEPGDQFLGEARAVVGNDDADRGAVPARLDGHPVAGELRGIFDQIAQAIEQSDIALEYRLAAQLRHLDEDGLAQALERRRDLLEQLADRHFGKWVAGVAAAQTAQLGENGPAARRLGDDELDIVGQRTG